MTSPSHAEARYAHSPSKSARAALTVPLTAATLLPIVALFGGFAAVVLWFGRVDFYHRHFFDAGAVVFADNLMRVLFALILCWLVYAAGAGILAILTRQSSSKLSPVERALAGFCLGAGIWHIALFTLGLLGFYYRSVMIGLCAATLLVSARHFGEVSIASWHAARVHLAELREGRKIVQTAGGAAVVLAGFILLLTRGLYPGGGGDYYTHYFYYYLEVIQNHGLTPNDVWYHYWYSKGDGLFFLGMLLTDPEAPALVTFCFVAFAALAIGVWTARMAPRSLWPALVVLLYLLFNVVGSGEFQKDHEMTSALLVLVSWALCMERGSRNWVFLAAAGAAGIAAAIVTQPMGILVCLFFGLLSVLSLLKGRWREMWEYGGAASAVGATVLAIFAVSYIQTGLPTDQALNLMLRFIDPSKLDRWGVLPQLVIVAWIRSNYEALALPFIQSVIPHLTEFIRYTALSPLLHSIQTFGLCILAISKKQAAKYQPNALDDSRVMAVRLIRSTLARIGLLIGMLILVSAFAGRVQSVTYERFSSFFFPLLVVLIIAACSWLLVVPFPRGLEWARRTGAPIAVLCWLLFSWQWTNDWATRTLHAAVNGMYFLVGRRSLAEAYSHQDTGLPFGGINPEALAAWRAAGSGPRIWATNVDSYCMVPRCVVESFASFKLSPHLDEIVSGSPEVAKQFLQQAGINYFLFLGNARFLDLLPYSRLFAPDTIGKYLGVKWADGTAYLLTWLGPDTRPIGDDFYRMYARKLAQPEHPWFRMSALAREIAEDTAILRSKQLMKKAVFHWQSPEAQGSAELGYVYVLDANYGANCQSFFTNARRLSSGNWTNSLRNECSDKKVCLFRIGTDRLGDPATGCRKDFSVSYRCAPGGVQTTITVPPEAEGYVVTLSCPPNAMR